MPATFTSKVSKAVAGSHSVRTTIPEAVAALLGLEPGSTLVWVLEPGEARATVEAANPTKKSPKRH